MARTTRLLTAALPASSPRSKSCDFLSAFRLPFGCAPIFARPSDKQCRGLPHACPTASYSSALCRRRCAPTCLRCFGNTRVLPLSPYVRKWSGLRWYGYTRTSSVSPCVRNHVCLRCFGNTGVRLVFLYVRKWFGLRRYGNTCGWVVFPNRRKISRRTSYVRMKAANHGEFADV